MIFHRPCAVGCLLLVCIVAISAAGCSSAARSDKMTPESFEVQTRHDAAVVVEVSGGRESSMWNNGEVSDEAFRKTLEESIRTSGVFSQVVPSEDGAAYILKVSGIKAESNEITGFDMRASFIATWELVHAPSNNAVWKDILATNHTCKVGDAFVGMERYRLAREYAARENVRLAIQEMSKVTLVGE